MQFAKLRSVCAAMAALLLFCNTAFAQTSFSWNGSISSDWTLPENWTPTGMPTATDNITISAAAPHQPVLQASGSIANLSISGGLLQLNGFTLTAAGSTCTFSGGSISNGTLDLALTGTATFSGTTFGAALVGKAGGLLFNGSTFNNTVNLTKTGSSSDICYGNNTFNGETSLTNNGSSYLRLANNIRDIFNANATFSNTGTSYVDVARHDPAGSQFNGNIVVNSISGTGVNFGLGVGVAVLAAGKTISVGNLGFTAGTLALRNFVQLGETPQTILLSGTSTLSFQTGTVFNGPLTSVSPSVALNGSTFNGPTSIEKTGSATNTFLGGNTFNGNTTIINSSSNYIRLANSTRDIFNADVTFSNTGTSYIDVARHDATGTEFNGNIVVNSTSGTGIYFCQGLGTAKLAAGKTIQAGNLGFTTGTLILANFTQAGNAAQQLSFGGTATVSFQTGSSFSGPVTVAAPGIVLTGTTFNAAASFHKTGSTTNNGAGGNVFNGTATFTSSGTGVFNLNNTGTDNFNDDIILNATAGSIRFGQSTGNATLAAGKTVRIGATGFSNTSLYFQNFRQLGNSPINLNLTGTASVSFQPGTILGGDITVITPGLTLDGGTFNGAAAFTKTGGASTSAGGNTFNGVTTITNSGSSFLRLSNSARDVYNGDVTFSNSGTSTSSIEVARNDASGTQFNGNVFVNNTSGSGIYICPAAGNGTATLAAGKTISVGSNGFSTGGLYLRNLTQAGTTAQSITFTGTTTQLHLLSGTVLNGDLSATVPSLFLNGATFNGTTSLTKTGSSANTSTGGCTFNGATTITNNGTGNLTMANATADDFNAAVQFVQRGKGLLQPAFNSASTFAGDISTAGSAAAIGFASGTNGRVVIDGSATQVFRGDAAYQPQVQRLTLVTPDGGKLQLQVTVNVLQDLAFTSGIIEATSTGSGDNGLLVLHNGITFSEPARNGSHVTGYVRKIGDTGFTFPTGNGTALRPIAISAPALTTDHFTAAYFNTDPGKHFSRNARATDINYLSHLEYWMLDRTGGEAEVQVKLWWEEQSKISDPLSLLVARWNGSSWVNEGNGGIQETGKAGTILSATGITSFSPFTFGSETTSFEANSVEIQGSLPVELIIFTASAKAHEVVLQWRTASEKDNAYFTVERSRDGKQFEEITIIKGSGNSSTPTSYNAIDQHPLPGTSYYRLKQTDFDGTYTYSQVVAINSSIIQKQDISLFPNPAQGAAFSVVLPATADKQLSVSVVDMQGREIYATAVTTAAANAIVRIELSQKLAAGVYLVTVKSSEGSYSKKLVVQ